MNSLTGYIGGDPSELGIPYGDPNASQHIVIAALAALEYRARTGLGQWVDLAQLEAYVTLIAEGLLAYQVHGREPERRGNRDMVIAPHNIYQTAGDDEWMSIACGTEDEWRALVDAIGDPELRAQRFATNADRKRHEDELDGRIGAWAATQDRFAASEMLQARGVAAQPVRHGKDLAHDPHLRARGFVFEMALDGESSSGIGNPWHMSGLAPQEELVSAMPGAETVEVMHDVLGLTEERIQEFMRSGALA
jgi:crotonobetainyl-CoA:carnitine CoA-transferase CaiB-like acyl-CoA transferase